MKKGREEEMPSSLWAGARPDRAGRRKTQRERVEKGED